MPRSSSGLVSSWKAVLSGSSGARATTSARLSFAGAPPAGSPCRLAASMLHIVCEDTGRLEASSLDVAGGKSLQTGFAPCVQCDEENDGCIVHPYGSFAFTPMACVS